MLCRPRDPERQTWDGRRAGLEGALEQCQVDRCLSIHDLNDVLPQLLENRELLFYPMGQSTDFDARVMHWRNVAKSKIRHVIHGCIRSRPPRRGALTPLATSDTLLAYALRRVSQKESASQSDRPDLLVL
uniref:Aminopeptidase P N-terminal domain-containing protein n=1 Tax=mine drainage metagenome TaxID=410659 RepID=E6Q1A5_9ZZZZ